MGIAVSRNPVVEGIFGFTTEELADASRRAMVPARPVEQDAATREQHEFTAAGAEDDAVTRVQEQIAAAAALKDGYLSLVSHELQSPIAVIVGNATMLLKIGETLARETRRQALQDIVTEGARLQGVIENLLVLTRMEGSEGLVLEPVSLRSLVAEQVQTQARRHPDHRLEVAVSEELPPVNGDRVLFEMVVENLLSNAIKYSSANTIVAITLATNAHDEVQIRVRDQGIGIEEHELEGVFTAFYRTPEALKQAKGMGLGLAVCKRIVEAHGGRIWAERVVGQGTEFVVSLPPLAASTAPSEA